jgi:formylglycine-generating enzyme required for sulfatase activity
MTMSHTAKRCLFLTTLLAAAPLLAPSTRSAPAPMGPSKQFTNSLKMKLVRIPAGKFFMGSPADEPNRQPNEGPRHEVEITKTFYLGAYEVTQGQYRAVMKTNPSAYSTVGSHKAHMVGLDTDDFPVDSVSWDNAVKFCEALSNLPAEKNARRVYRLPTEAEWEYACRAGTTTAFHVGATLSLKQAHIGGPRRPERVGKFAPNAWGLYDMHGNVWEWTADWYDENFYAKSPKKDPVCTTPGRFRLARGGAWLNDAQAARCAYRGWTGPSGYHHIGFRVACTVGGGR